MISKISISSITDSLMHFQSGFDILLRTPIHMAVKRVNIDDKVMFELKHMIHRDKGNAYVDQEALRKGDIYICGVKFVCDVDEPDVLRNEINRLHKIIESKDRTINRLSRKGLM